MRKISISAPVLPQAASPTLGRSAGWATAAQTGWAGDQVLSPFTIASPSSSHTFSVPLLSATICNLAFADKQLREPGWSIPWVSVCTWRGCELPALWFAESCCPWTAVWAGCILWHVNSTWWSLMQLPHLRCREEKVRFLRLTHDPYSPPTPSVREGPWQAMEDNLCIFDQKRKTFPLGLSI